MKKLFKTFATLMMVAVVGSLAACSGGAGDDVPDGESILFGKVPVVQMKIDKIQQEITLERKTATKQKELMKAEEKEQKMKDEMIPKLEEAAKALDGKQLDISEGDFKVTSPLSLTYENYSRTYSVRFKFSGEAVAARDLTGASFLKICLAGYDAEGNELFRDHVGYIESGDYKKETIVAGTPAKVININCRPAEAEAYLKATVLKLMVE